MTLKNAKHCDGFGCMFVLGYYGFFAVFNYMVPLSMLLKKIQEKKKNKKGLFQGLGFFTVFMGFFYEGSYILNRLNFVHNPEITLNIKMQIQVCAFVIAVDFIKR